MGETDYVIRITDAWPAIDAQTWNALLARQPHATPFMRHEYLAALQASGSAVPQTGWNLRCFTLWQGGTLAAACALYAKGHSYGEYVFDWAWASAYEQHGLDYYPKAVVAVPFTPVPGTRLLARDATARAALVRALVGWCGEQQLSSLHLLFASAEDVAACEAAGLLLRHGVQFHWKNDRYPSFDDFLARLSQDKRKKIRQERRKVRDAGVTLRWARGADIRAADWDFFYRCYARTYREHGNPPYLTRDFFARMADTMPEHWLLFTAEREGHAIATSLIAITADISSATGQFCHQPQGTAYGRYWGALERVDCLHFEACYYQPLEWCIAHGVACFEGGAQGEHKMARALLPTPTASAHWLAHPAFNDAVARFLEREDQGMAGYLDELRDRSPFKR
ncbi:GNAT family N-acetyltransferase [Ramlibacter sp. H39-3-26]|uniref:GNAT family N-acetyltransferase n=1 Tax=Curvibacter soli TaxID=3031331 RepID=UPI0023DB7B5A|nr:GNAT family N-acetyltransferase [Ramlibacter sp. H39-3-26]MDF1485230.1 GNAT family N-acetyltransferase [Ramlibacter sp. H39-3-26]